MNFVPDECDALRPLPAFEKPAKYPAGAYPRLTAVADLDGDGALDLAAANSDSDNLTLLFNDRSGGFKKSIFLPAARQPIFLSAGDLDQDGDHDLVSASGPVAFYENQGGGMFLDPLPLEGISANSNISIRDFDRDGLQDLAAISFGNFVEVFFNEGESSWTRAGHVFLSPDQGYGSLASADFNGDGLLDLAAVTSNSSILWVVINEGNRGFVKTSRF
ncbi:MAG: VCBS repeat-containing protein [Planctomycetes bacterium]|nr:VCBS repeat-containing protein [Planctomycetota bacterium]